MSINIRKLAEQRESELKTRQGAAMARWKPYIDIVENFYKGQQKELSEYQKANIAQCCDNVFDFFVLGRKSGMISETTYSDAIAFARQMLPTIPALLPSLVADNVAVVQAIDRPQAQVYYMNLKYGTTKGAITAGETAISAISGHDSREAGRLYASDRVIGEANSAGSGAQTLVLAATARKPIIAGSITVSNVTTTISAVQGLETFYDNGDGTLTGSNGSTGTYVTTTGVITLDAGSGNTIDAATAANVAYRFNVEKDTAGIGELDLEVTSSNVDAEVFPLKLTYTVFSAINLQKLHGMVLADEGMKFATQEIRFAIDQVVLGKVLEAASNAGAATGPGTFNATVGSGQEWVWRIHEFKRYISKASANIFAKTLRATGNVIVAGINVCSLVEQLPEYKPAAGLGTKPPAGPYVHGTLGNRMVICNPFYDPDDYVVLFRGDNWLFAGLVYAPYVPLYSTDPVTLADLNTQRGFMSMAATKIINYGMFSKGAISGY
jgi:hypothetical protein